MPPFQRQSAPGGDVVWEGELPRAGRHVRRSVLGAGAAMCLVVALCAVVLHRAEGGLLGVYLIGPAAPADWQTYRDPLGLFRARLPPTWTAQTDIGEESYGDRTGSATEPTEGIQFRDPALGAGSARFEVDAAPIKSAFERHWYCQGSYHKWSSFLFLDATRIFDTANAHFQLGVWIPRVAEPPHSQPLQLTPVPTATPLPPQTVAADLSVLSTILGTFEPTNATALSCP